MKDYFISILLFVLVVVGVTRLAEDSFFRYQTINNDLMYKEVAAVTTSKSIEYKTAQLKAQLGTADAQTFQQNFGVALRSMQDVSQIAQSINRQAETLFIPIQEQKTGELTLPGRVASTLKQIQAHTYSIALTGDFKDCLTWIGIIEDMYPLARIEKTRMTPSGEMINLSCSIVFPRFDPRTISRQ
jgi:hypothetical protein